MPVWIESPLVISFLACDRQHVAANIRPTGLTGSLEQAKSAPSSRGLDIGSREDNVGRLIGGNGNGEDISMSR